jgi:uncharacterized secreted protein with C-terminal beta-propeller domain
MLPKRVAETFAVAFLALAACGKNPRQLSNPAAIELRVALSPAASCDTLAQSVRDTAVRQMRAQLDEEKDWGSQFRVAGAGGAPQPAGGPASYSTTNTQVAGVDEADFVKNDGTRIFVLSGRTLFAARSWPPQSLALAGKIDLEGWPTAMFLDGNQMVIISSIWTVPSGGGMGPGVGMGAGTGGVRPCGLDGAGCFFGWGTTKITVVDVSVLSAPKVLSELYLPGSSAGARRVGSSVRLVLSDMVRWPEAVKWWPDYDPRLYQDHHQLVAAIDALEDANEAIIRAAPLQSWFPNGQRKLPDGKLIDVGYQCADFYLPNAPVRLGLVTIATLDLAHLDAGVSRASIVGEAGVLYATANHLYLASKHWWWWRLAGQHEWTYLHEFDISDLAKTGYLASGGVEGQVGDQFAMDEKDGYLRIATTTVSYSQDPKTPRSFRLELSNRLSVFASQPVTPRGGAAPVGNTLVLIGEVAPLVEGERLMSTRFTGDAGYAVTFRNVDPLVTLDLSDPAHPKKVAELTLPGFSTYLQPIDAGHLLAIGQYVPLDASGRADWRERAVQLSLFDVSDLSHPVRTAQVLVGTASAYSEALWDHHAFNWYRPDAGKPGLLAIPFSDWIQPARTPWWDGFVSDVRVFSVDPASGIVPVGALSLSDVYIQRGEGNWSWWYRPWVRRSVMATDQAGNTFVYAVSDAGVRVAALAHLDTPLATALFPASSR